MVLDGQKSTLKCVSRKLVHTMPASDARVGEHVWQEHSILDLGLDLGRQGPRSEDYADFTEDYMCLHVYERPRTTRFNEHHRQWHNSVKRGAKSSKFKKSIDKKS